MFVVFSERWEDKCVPMNTFELSERGGGAIGYMESYTSQPSVIPPFEVFLLVSSMVWNMGILSVLGVYSEWSH